MARWGTCIFTARDTHYSYNVCADGGTLLFGFESGTHYAPPWRASASIQLSAGDAPPRVEPLGDLNDEIGTAGKSCVLHFEDFGNICFVAEPIASPEARIVFVAASWSDDYLPNLSGQTEVIVCPDGSINDFDPDNMVLIMSRAPQLRWIACGRRGWGEPDESMVAQVTAGHPSVQVVFFDEDK